MKILKSTAWTHWLLGWAMLGTLSLACAQTMVVHAAAGVKSPLEGLSHAFALETSSELVLNFDTAGAAMKHYVEDEKADALITTQERIEQSVIKGELSEGRWFTFASTVAGLAGAQYTGLAPQNASALKAMLLASKSIAISDPARGATVGQHFMQVIAQLGIQETVMPKVRLARDGLQTMEWVRRHEVELGVTQLSEIIQADPSTLIGPFPKPFELKSQYALWLKHPESAQSKTLLTWLRSQAGQQVLLDQGLQP